MTQRREKLKQNIKAQLTYVKDFFRKDQKESHVHYVGILIHPGLYIAAFLLAIVLYLDYLYTDHFDYISQFIAKIDDKATKAKETISKTTVDNQEWGLTVEYCAIVTILIVLSLMSYKYYLKKKRNNSVSVIPTSDNKTRSARKKT